ncbi:hypothetical protein [Halobacteriovorax sp.]|uniref:hypothetical protein n=1 Tax=Halobacteriovorax sp. TaxID=2020862 RepID=UPI0035680EEE
MKIFLTFFLLFSIEASSLVENCDGGLADDCFEYAYKKSLEGDQLAPLIYFEKGCDLKDGKSCYALDRVNKKLNQKKDSTDLLKKSCEYSFAMGCYELGEYNYKMKNYLNAVENFEKGCSLGLKKSCAKRLKYDTYFSKVIRSSQEELSDEQKKHQEKYLSLLKKRMKSLEKKCLDKNYKSCTRLAKNNLFLANLKEARKWAEIACNNKSARGCLALGEVEQKEGKLELVSFERACNLELGPGCVRYAQSIENKNLARAMSFYRRSCQAKNQPAANSCIKYSTYQKSNPKLAKKFKLLACKLDSSLCPL